MTMTWEHLRLLILLEVFLFLTLLLNLYLSIIIMTRPLAPRFVRSSFNLLVVTKSLRFLRIMFRALG